MPICPKCQSENPDSFKFCTNCGISIASPPAASKESIPARPDKPNKTLRYLLIGLASFIVFVILVSITVNLTQDKAAVQTSAGEPRASSNLSTLHGRLIGHWLEYTSHMNAFISEDAIVLKREDGPRLESYKYRVYSEDKFLSTLILKVKQVGDANEESWEAQVIDYGQGLSLTIGRAHFSYVDSQTVPSAQ